MAKKKSRPAGPANETPAPAADAGAPDPKGSAPPANAAEVPAPTDAPPAPAAAQAPTPESVQAPAQESAQESEQAPGPRRGWVVVVKAHTPRRRRAGRLFTPQPTRIPADDLSAEDLAALETDFVLSVEVVPED